MAFLKFNKSELVNLEYSLKREIIYANKIGAYCNTSIVTCNTRRYHGLLAVPIENFGGGKYMLLSSVDESIAVSNKQFNLGIHCYGDIYEPRGHKYIVDFDVDPIPEIVYKVGDILFTKEIFLVPYKNQVMLRYTLLESSKKILLKLKPFLAFRNIHSLTRQNPEACTEGTDIEGGVAYRMYDGFPDLHLQTNKKSEFTKAPYWYKGVTYTDEKRRGFDCTEDLLVPGEFSIELRPGESVILSASTEEEKTRGLKRRFDAIADLPPVESFHDQLVFNANQLKCFRGEKEQITAGFSWMHTGLLRETIIALPGLTLYADGNKAEFEKILDTLIADEQERLFHRTTQVESPLRLTDTIQQYIAFGADEKKVWKKYGPTLKGVIESYAPGRRREVAMHPNGLLWAQMDWTALTWMNTYIGGRPVNERAGYQVETNAMWYNALCFAVEMEGKHGGATKDEAFISKWSAVRDQVKNVFQDTFWNYEAGYLADYVDRSGQNLDVRPNQLFAVSLDYSPLDDEVKSQVMAVIANELVTRRGIRSLSPRNIKYKGVYEGTQTERDLAYHNGCTFTHLLAEYVKASFSMIGPAFYKKAEFLSEGYFEDISKHGVGSFSELYDGDPPHEPHGAISSACSTASLLRIEYLMNQNKEEKK